MTPAIGSRLGPYEIVALLGAGGMGEVYKARDTRLDRVVAIKVLRAHLAADPDRRARFEREAKLISQLNHPHICTLYDVGQHDGTDYLVIEYLEGQTLADRLQKGPLSIAQALDVAIQIAGALDAAHRVGIVHRDLKPANVMLTKGGAKLLDFGIARAVAPGTAAVTAPPTLMAEGTLLGTLQYMAPEQLEGRDADGRSDLFAFGAVLYEMLTGRRAFAGSSQSSVIAAVLDSEPPPIAAAQPLTPPALDQIVTTCLAKNPDERWQSASDVRRQLEWIVAGAGSTPATAGRRSRGGVHGAWVAAAATSLVALIAVGVLMWFLPKGSQGEAASPRVTRATIAAPGTAAVYINAGRSVAITPDGTRLVYIGNNGTQLFVHALDRLESTAIYTGALPLNEVFMAPGGQWVGFEEGATLKKIALTGGPAELIARGVALYGAAWAPDDTIIFHSTDPDAGLVRAPAGGGAVTVLTRPDAARGERAHILPEMLPGGRAVLFTITAVTGGADAAQVAVLDLAAGTYKVLVRGGSHGHYVRSGLGSPQRAEREGGHLVYVKARNLMAVPFDFARMEVSGMAALVVPRLAVMSSTGTGHFDVASDGTLAYADVDAPDADLPAARTLAWVDWQGREEPLSVSLPVRPYGQPRLSPDGKRVAVSFGGNVWQWDVARQTLGKVTSGSETGFFQEWTIDSRRLIFGRTGGGIFAKSADGTGEIEVLSNARGAGMLPSSVTPDGTRVLFSLGAVDVMAMALDTRRVEPLVQTPSDERNGVVSPDGRWLAYESKGGTGPFEIYVKPYPNVGAGEWPISTGGGTRPLWAPNGQELFFVATDGTMMAVHVEARGSAWSAGVPVKLFKGPYETGSPASGRNYDVSRDGTRFLMVRDAPGAASAAVPQIVIVQHWFEELNRLAPAAR